MRHALYVVVIAIVAVLLVSVVLERFFVLKPDQWKVMQEPPAAESEGPGCESW